MMIRVTKDAACTSPAIAADHRANWSLSSLVTWCSPWLEAPRFLLMARSNSWTLTISISTKVG